MTIQNRNKSRVWLLVGALCVLAAGPARAFDTATADRVLEFARQQLRETATDPGIPTDQYPKASVDGTWRLVPNTARIDWVQGFFPGQLWFMYGEDRDSFWRTRADAWTRDLELQKSHPDITQLTHDLGFKFFTSFGNAYRMTGDDYYRQVLLTAAGSLARRYNPTVGVIDCCDWNRRWTVPMVTDTMMNLELLFWAARNGGNPAWSDMALSHALKTAEDMIRDNGGTWHVVNYNTSGGILSKETYQGYSADSTWARGHAWAIHGFTMAYRYTRDPRMLEAARRVTEYYLARLPPDYVPYWDFDAPADQREKDSSAAAIVASALLELSTFVPDTAVAQRYRNAALATLDSLSSPAYLAAGTTSPGILLHGVAFYRTAINPRGEDIDRSLIYGDYYFVEAVLRFKQQAAGSWLSSLDFSASVRNLGPGHTGVQQVEFDLTPLTRPVDGVIGYADSSTPVRGYSDLAMTIRMNPAGFFDVRRGDRFAALASLPYQANTTYHVRMVTDLDAKVYSVWITPPGGSEVLLAEEFPFRTGAPPTDDLGQVALRSARFDYDFRVNNHTVRAEGEPPPPPPVEWFSTTDFSQSVHDLGPGNTGVREVLFDLVPLRSPTDSVVGYADSSTPVRGYSDLAMTIRMNPAGFFDVRRGDRFAALASLPYQANTTYHVRMVTDLDAKVYSVWITPPGGSEVLLADRFAFRAGAPPTDDLGQVALRTIGSDGEFKVVGHTVRPVGAPPPPPPVEWFSTTDFSASVRNLGPGHTGVREVLFDLVPLRSPTDSVVGYADSSTPVRGYSDLAMTIRMNPAGFFDVRRGDRFAALASLPYQANTTYRVRMVTDLNAKVYSVWITPPGGSEVLLADRFAFRAGAPPTDDLGQVALRTIGSDGEFKVVGHTVRAVDTLSGSGLDDDPMLASAVLDEESLQGCAAAPGSMLTAAGLLLWLLSTRRRRR